MAKSAYSISLARPGYEALWADLFVDKNPTEEARKAEREGAFNSDIIEATNFEEAVRKAQAAHPGWTVINVGTGRIG